jgi:hypothetical protein
VSLTILFTDEQVLTVCPGDYVEIGYWSTIEVDVGVICACMPAMRSFFVHLFPKLFGTTVPDDYSRPSYGHNRSMQSGSKLDAKISQRPKESDESDFIPLVDVQSQTPSQPQSFTQSYGQKTG